MEKKTRYRLRRSQFHHQEQKHLILITCWSWRVLANSSIQITSLNPYSSHFIRVTIISIIKDETADAGDVSLLIQDHTENKRLSQKRIPSLLVAKNPSIASHGKPRQGERSPEEGRKPQRWSSDLETTKYPPKTHPVWLDRELWEGWIRLPNLRTEAAWRASMHAERQPGPPHAWELAHGSYFRVSNKYLCARPSQDHSLAPLYIHPGKRAMGTSKTPVIIANCIAISICQALY